MTRKWLTTVCLVALALPVVLTAGEKQANALTFLNSPFGDSPVLIFVATISGEPWVAWQPLSGGQCAYNKLGDSSGLTDSYILSAGSGNDEALIPGFDWEGCGYALSEVNYQGHYVDIDGGDGDDYLVAYAGGDSWLYGAAGNDILEIAGNGSSAFGDLGNDKVSSYQSNNRLLGGSGNDCLWPHGGVAAEVSCGSGSDKVITSPINASADCEVVGATSC